MHTPSVISNQIKGAHAKVTCIYDIAIYVEKLGISHHILPQMPHKSWLHEK